MAEQDIYQQFGLDPPPQRPAFYRTTLFGLPISSKSSADYDARQWLWEQQAAQKLQETLHPYSVGQAQALLPPGLTERLAGPENMRSVTTQEPSLVPSYQPGRGFPPSSPQMRQGTAYGPGSPQELQGPGTPTPRFSPTELSMMSQAGGGVEASQPLLEAYAGMRDEGPRPTIEGPRPTGMTPMAQEQYPRLYGPTPPGRGQVTGQYADTTTSPSNSLGPGSPFQLAQQPSPAQSITRQELDPTSPVNAAMRDRLASELHRQSLRGGTALDPEYQDLRKQKMRAEIGDIGSRGGVRERRADREDQRLTMQQEMAQARIAHLQGLDARATAMAKAGRSPADIQLMKLEVTKAFHRAQVAALLRNAEIPEDDKAGMIADLMSFEKDFPIEAIKEPSMTIPGTDISLGSTQAYKPKGGSKPTSEQDTVKPGESPPVPQKELSAEQAAKERDSVAESTRPTPKQGDVIGGYRFKGGDPNKQSSWEKVD